MYKEDIKIIDKIDSIEISKRRSILLVIIMFLMLIVVAMVDSGKYTKEEQAQMQKAVCVEQQVNDLTFIAC